MTKKERVKELVKAVAHLNDFDIMMEKIGFEFTGSTDINNPLCARDLILNEFYELLNFESSDEETDTIIALTRNHTNTIDTYEKQFDIIWKEFGTDES